MLKGYIGNYAEGASAGICSFVLDEQTGVLEKSGLFCPVKNSNYLFEGQDGYIFSTYGDNGGGGVAVCSPTGELIDSLAFDPNPPCHVVGDGEFIYTANYHAGTVAKLSFVEGKLELVKKVLIKEKGGCHQIILMGGRILLPALLCDRLYVMDKNLNIIDEVAFAESTGPRHGLLSPNEDRLYLVTELSNELYTFRFENGKLVERNRLYLLPRGQIRCEGSAAIRMTRDATTLMISTRFANIITVVDITEGRPKAVQHYNLPGDHPRDILLVAEDRYLLVANRFSDELICLEVRDNRIVGQISKIEMPQAVAILMNEYKEQIDE